jgi:hypothetical protein
MTNKPKTWTHRNTRGEKKLPLVAGDQGVRVGSCKGRAENGLEIEQETGSAWTKRKQNAGQTVGRDSPITPSGENHCEYAKK